jgi:hypothetical protein
MSASVLGFASEDVRLWNYVAIGIVITTLEAFSLTSSSEHPWSSKGGTL